MRYKRFNFLLIYLTVALGLFAQGDFTFRNICLREGMSNGQVLDLCIDSQGFVWAATESGLNRISGNRCTVFKTDNSAIASNEQTKVLFDTHNNKVWVVTKRDGISVYDCQKQQFTTLSTDNGLASNVVADICQAEDGGLWIAHVGGFIQHYDSKTGALKTLGSREHPPCKRIRSIFYDNNGHLYIGLTTDGLAVFDTKGKEQRHFRHREGDTKSLPGNNVRKVFIDRQHRIWVGTNQGLGLLNPITSMFQVFRRNGSDQTSLAGDNVYDIKEMADGTLWIASDLGGISIVQTQAVGGDASDMKFVRLDKTLSRLSSDNIRCIEQDAFGNIWVGGYSTGIDFISKDNTPFHVLDIHGSKTYGLAADQADNVWLGGENEIFMIKKTKITRHSFASCVSIPTIAKTVCADRDGCLWLGLNDDGVVRYDTKSNACNHIRGLAELLDVQSIYQDKDGKIWIGSEAGVYSYKEGVAKEETKLMNHMKRSKIVFGLGADRQGRLWVGTKGNGVYVFDGKQKLVCNMTTDSGLCSNDINHIYADTEGGMWIATHNGLAYIPDTKKLADIRIFNGKQGLADSHVRAICRDYTGNVWASTFTGIACLNIRKDRFLNYNYQNGVTMGNFVEGSVTATSDGTIYFGSPDGVCYFNPRDITSGATCSHVQIIACEDILSAESGLPHPFTPDKSGTIQLSYKENTFKFAFTVSDFAQKGNVEYSYMMKGLDDKWRETESDNEVTFRNIAPGRYTFRIRARLKNQDWDDENMAEMNIHVNPPFWRTWWAYLLYVVLGLGIIYYYFRSYKHKLRLQSLLEMKRREGLKIQELNEERLRFYTNITHELRTPLTLIMGPLEDLVEDKRLPELFHKKVSLVNDSAQRLLELVNDLLEFRKTETQNRRLAVARGDLGALVKEVGMRFKELNRNPKVSIHVLVMPSIQPVYFDSEIIMAVLNNLLSNAVKYTREGKINLIMNTDGHGFVNVIVADTGCGIAKDALPHIFERYYQAKGKHQASGTGIGLALVKSLAELHEGILSVESKEGEGTKFTFSLKMDNTYPNALHKEDTEEAKPESTANEDETGGSSDQLPLLLIVEDNKDIRQYIAESMGEDYRVIQAADGREGIKAAQEQIPDIIVSDIMMPEMDGIQMTKTLKEDIRTSHIPIILLTAKDKTSDKEEGYDSGTDSYLTKPFSAKLLNSRIRNLLLQRHRLAELLVFRSQNASVPEVGETAQEIDTPTLSPIDQDFLDRLNRVIEENIAKEDINMQLVSEQLNMSYSTFYRKSKAILGMSANEFIRKKKLKYSLQLLQSGNYNVNQAALMAGFSDMPHFREVFKKEFGKTPSEFLKRGR